MLNKLAKTAFRYVILVPRYRYILNSGYDIATVQMDTSLHFLVVSDHDHKNTKPFRVPLVIIGESTEMFVFLGAWSMKLLTFLTISISNILWRHPDESDHLITMELKWKKLSLFIGQKLFSSRCILFRYHSRQSVWKKHYLCDLVKIYERTIS